MKLKTCKQNKEQMNIEIINQGRPRINFGGIKQKGYKVTAAFVDLHSKYCDIGGIIYYEDGCPGIIIDYNDRSIHFDESEEGLTEIKFPEFEGYDIWSAQINRYTLYLCFVEIV